MKEKNDTKEFYSISELSEEFEISTRSIRFYEEKDLISPKRTDGNQRIYTRRERARLRLILRGKRFGYSLDEISGIIGMTDIDFDEIDQITKTIQIGKKRVAEIRDRINELILLEEDLLTFQKKIEDRLQTLKEST